MRVCCRCWRGPWQVCSLSTGQLCTQQTGLTPVPATCPAQLGSLWFVDWFAKWSFQLRIKLGKSHEQLTISLSLSHLGVSQFSPFSSLFLFLSVYIYFYDTTERDRMRRNSLIRICTQLLVLHCTFDSDCQPTSHADLHSYLPCLLYLCNDLAYQLPDLPYLSLVQYNVLLVLLGQVPQYLLFYFSPPIHLPIELSRFN